MATKKQEAYDVTTPLNSIRQETFVSNLLSNMNQADAYLAAYKTCKSRETAKVNASRLLLTNANLKARLAYKRTELAKKLELTIANLQERLIKLADTAESKGKEGVARACISDLLKTIGGFQADVIPDKNIAAKMLDKDIADDIRKIIDSRYRQKYLAEPDVKQVESTEIKPGISNSTI